MSTTSEERAAASSSSCRRMSARQISTFLGEEALRRARVGLIRASVRQVHSPDHVKASREHVLHQLVAAIEVADEANRLDIGKRLDEVEVLGKVRLGRRAEVLELTNEEGEDVLLWRNRCQSAKNEEEGGKGEPKHTRGERRRASAGSCDIRDITLASEHSQPAPGS